jgi:hypothetical protein
MTKVAMMKINNKIALYSIYLKTVKRQEAYIQGLIHPAEANLAYFLVSFQSLQLTSTQSENLLTAIPFVT